MPTPQITRRGAISLVASTACLAPNLLRADEPLPSDDPAAHLKFTWTSRLPWANVVNIQQMEGTNWREKLEAAQRNLMPSGGGVVYFPAGTYQFDDHILIQDGIILRGEASASPRAVDADFQPQSRIEFPQYVPSFTGQGTPIESAFKGIRLRNPSNGGNTGVVNLAINRGHIHLGEGDQHQFGPNRIVFGCLLTNAAVADPAVPYLKDGQPTWQRFTHRHHAAIDVKASQNLLVANNRLPQSGKDNFTMTGYQLKDRKGQTVTYDVTFDYDNRPGLYVNHFCVGGSGGSGNDGTPETHPFGFRKGISIVDNYVFNTGRMGIGFCGDRVLCARNVTRIAKDIWRPTATGRKATTGASTNDNRAIEARGWRWTIEDNDCIVHRNWCADRGYLINDGEGIMHEDHCNSAIVDSVLRNNRINSYLSLYKCGPIDGLVIEGNDVSTPGKIADIYVVSNRNSGPFPCRNVKIIGNTTRSNGIQISGSPASGNVVSNNRHDAAETGFLRNEAAAVIDGNTNYS